VSQDIAAGPAAHQILAAPLATQEEVDHGHDEHVHTFFDADQFPAHQFEDSDQQKESAALGMWAFLATEVLLFAGLFMVYIIYRNWYHDGFVIGSHALNVTLGTINTFVLLASSFTVVLAINQAQKNNSRGIVLYLILTILFGLTFFAVKAFEWHADYEEGLIPWFNWNEQFAGERNYQVKMFMTLYFIMTSTHAVHMIVGAGILAYLALKARKGAYDARYHTPLEMGGLYWHFVDIVWVFLVPTLYLIDLYHDTGLHPGH
jgi:cytochrome c oxidase subunit 3